MRRVRRPEAEMEIERLLRIGLLAVGDERDGLVDQILAQVIPLLRLSRRLHLVVVVDEVRIPLARVATKEPVEALKAPPQRPAVIRPRGSLLVRGRQMPLADHERAVAVLEQHLRQHPVLERDDTVVARIAGRELRDAGHPVGVMVAPGHDARPRLGEHSAVVCMLLKRSPLAAIASKLGVSIGLP